jgi:hypothetical protein
MNQRTLVSRLLSPAGFGLVLLCLALPFVTVSCSVTGDGTTAASSTGSATASFSGLDLVMGGSPDVSTPDGPIPINSDSDQIYQNQVASHLTDDPFLIAALVVLFVAMATALVGSTRLRLALGAILAAVAGLLMVGAEVRLIQRLNDSQLWVPIVGPYKAEAARPAIGFYVAVALLVVLAAGHVLQQFRTELLGPLLGTRGSPVDSDANLVPGLELHGSAPPESGSGEEPFELVSGFLTDDEIWRAPPPEAAPADPPSGAD